MKQFIKYTDFVSLNESKKTAKKRWLETGQIDKDTFNDFVKMDPSKSFKYVEKLLQFHLKDNVDEAELSTQVNLFHKYAERNLIDADIQRLSYSEFVKVVNDADDKAKEIDNRKEKLAGVQTVLDTENFLVVIPDNQEASCKYGATTKWCTAATGGEMNHFNRYRFGSNVTLYYIIDKKAKSRTPKSKIAVAVYPSGTQEIYNSNDKTINWSQVPSEIPRDIFISREPQGKDAEFNKLLFKYGLDDAKVTHNPDGSIDYNGDFDLSGQGLTEIPFKFRKITGDLNLNNNLLASLKNCAVEVGKRFACSNNRIESLEFGPQKVGTFYDCSYNDISSLENLPKDGEYELNCSNNKLKDLSGGPETVRSVICRDNPLESLRGIKEVKFDLFCDHTSITTLEGMPHVGRDIILYSNELTTLKGIQFVVNGKLDISYNRLQNIDYLPTKYSKLECEGNPVDLEKMADSRDNI